MPSLSDLIKTPTADEWVGRFTGFLRLAGFPVGAWQPLSFKRFTVETESSLLAELGTIIADIAKGGFARLAKGGWLDLVAENVFSDARKPALNTTGEVVLTDVAGVGPLTIGIGTTWFGNTSKALRYVVTGLPYGTSVPLSGTLRVVVRAELAGAAYNVGNNAITEFVTSLPGLAVSNPPIGTTGTWILTQGVDVEKDEILAGRLLDKWALLGTGSNDGAYRYHAASASPEVTRVRVWSPGAGSVRVAVAGPSGPVSSAALTLVQTKIAEKRPLGVPDVTGANASVLTQPIVGTLHLAKGQDPATRLAAAQAAVDAYARVHPIGAKLSRERVLKDLFVDGVEDLTITSPAADVVLTDAQIYVPSFTLTTTVAT